MTSSAPAAPFDPARIGREALPGLLRSMPKAELHIHIEGSLEPELIFALAGRNGVTLPYASVEALRAAYAFTDLQSFLDIYYAGASVLLEEADFFDMAMAYFRRAAADRVVHAELFFDPQTHTERGVPIQTVIRGLARAQRGGGPTTCRTASTSSAWASTAASAGIRRRSSRGCSRAAASSACAWWRMPARRGLPPMCGARSMC